MDRCFFIVLLVNTAYVAAFATPSIFYMTNVLFHLVTGVGAGIAVVIQVRKDSTLLNSVPRRSVCLGFRC